MTPAEVRAAREKLGLTQYELATMLGYRGLSRRQAVWDLEHAHREKKLLEPQRRLIEAYLAGYRPADWPQRAHLSAAHAITVD